MVESEVRRVEDPRDLSGSSRLIISIIYKSRDRSWFPLLYPGSEYILGLVPSPEPLVPYVNTLVPDTHLFCFTGNSLVPVPQSPFVHLAFNKPIGAVCRAKREKRRGLLTRGTGS